MAEPSGKTANHSDHPHGGTSHETVRDPVCGMSVDPTTSKHRFEYGDETFHFCSAGCRTKFMADPAKYLEKADKPKTAAKLPEGTIYTCPMHPEVRQDGPGSCPICGMALEPEIANLTPVLTCEEVVGLQQAAAGVSIEPSLLDYAHEIVGRTRKHADVELGVSPRGALLWISTARAMALIEGRNYLIPDDLKKSSVPALAHRLSILAAHDTEEISAAQDRAVREIVNAVEVPR